MADVRISQLPLGTPSGTGVIPYSDGTITTKVTIDQILSLQSGVPSGFIGLWSGAADAIPAGWVLCDGSNGTPNLIDRFILGAGTSTPAVGTTGGSKDAIVVSHTHTATDSGHSHGYTAPAGNGQLMSNNTSGRTAPTGRSTDTGFANITVSSTGQSGVNANMPPYYALCYIMKV